MVKTWLAFAWRQLASALVVVTSILLLSEILLPSSILPYLNLHALIIVTVLVCLSSASIEYKSRWRIIILLPIIVLLLGYAFLLFGTSVSGIMLLVALAILLLGFLIALTRSEREPQVVEQIITEEVIIKNDSIEIIEEETSVFMR